MIAAARPLDVVPRGTDPPSTTPRHRPHNPVAPMNTLSPRRGWIVLAALFLAAWPRTAAAEAPAGFTPIFNGKDLSGWHGMPHFDPYKLAAMDEAGRKALLEKWTEEAKQHWT